MAAKQRDISVSEFFAKNRHLLGFDNPRKALLTTVKEAVDNSLDACEEASLVPEIWVHIESTGTNRYKVGVQDNGPGIMKKQIPLIFGKLLYGSKFHRLRMSRGQQGIGISAAGMYGMLTTGKPVKIISKISIRKPSHYYELQIDTKKNRPEILNKRGEGEDIPPGEKGHKYLVKHGIEWVTHYETSEGGKEKEVRSGTRVTIELEGRFHRGRGSVDDYLEQTAIANPHVTFHYEDPEGNKRTYQRSTTNLPVEPMEIKPHPYGVELGRLMTMLRDSSDTTMAQFLGSSFSRVSPGVARRICEGAGLTVRSSPKRIGRQEADALYQSIQETKIKAPATDCLSPIGEERILASLEKQVAGAGFYQTITRSPSVYRGNPFQIEVGLAYGGELSSENLATVYRYANRVPLLYQAGACALTKSVLATNWKSYGLQKARGALPTGPLVLMVHIASVWVPFTSESKEAVAGYDEIIKEVKLALQQVGRQLGAHIKRAAKARDAERKSQYIEKYIPHVGIALREILSLSDREEKKIVTTLTDTLRKSRKM